MSILIRGQIARTNRIGFTLGIAAGILIYALSQAAHGAPVTCNKQGCSDAFRQHRHARTFSAKRHPSNIAFDANGNHAGLVVSHKTGARAHVATRYAAQFQAYVNDLEAAGARIYFMGGYRKGHGSIPRHKHPLGMALDVCQLARGRVAARCRIPSRHIVAAIARRHGLLEGGVWCHSDYGHVEVRTHRQAAACRNRIARSQ